MKHYELDDFLHPLDRQLSRKVMDFPGTQKVLDMVFQEDLDRTMMYVYSASHVRLPEHHPAVCYLAEGCRMFGVEKVPAVYVRRNYYADVECIGYEDPVVLIPEVLLLTGEESLIRGRMMAAAASIRADHHKLTFLLWLLENVDSLIPVPFAAKAIRAVIYEWMRAQAYTCDRAFLLASEDITLARKNILFGSIPREVLDNFTFGENGTFEEQVAEYSRNEGVLDMASKVSGFFQVDVFLPARYQELGQFHDGRREQI